MFREMRRNDRALSATETEALLVRGEYGVLSTCGANSYPYGVPLSYAYADGVVYFHSAMEGSKLDNLAACDKVSFCVVGHTHTLPDKFSTEYESAIVFGRAAAIMDEEKQKALLALVQKYSPDFLDSGKAYIERAAAKTNVMKIVVEHMSGKARR